MQPLYRGIFSGSAEGVEKEEKQKNFDGVCWECWDDQLTDESMDMFGDFM
ncbi:MAG: hypothetical protein QW510_02705 [Candidatus Bathyarchaeia archaeon]